MRIKINKLFGKYSTETDLNDKCVIFIGENGIGKSTTLKIIEAIIKMKYIDLLKYNFDSFEVNNIIVNYDELVPLKRDLLQSVSDIDSTNYNKLKQIIDNINYDEYFELIRSAMNDRLTIMLKKKISSIFYSNKNFKYENDNNNLLLIIKKHITKLIKNGMMPLCQEYKYNALIIKGYDKSFSLNMVRDYNIINNNEKLIQNDIDTNIEGPEFYEYKEKYKTMDFQKYLRSNIISFNNILKYDVFNDISKNKINLSKILFKIYYNEREFERIIEKYYNYIVNNNLPELNEYRMYNLTPEDIIYMNYFIGPLLPKDSFLDIDMYEMKEKMNVFYDFMQKEKLFYEGIKSNNKTENLQRLFDKYFVNKKIIVTPAGIIVKFNEKEYDEIDYNSLSEGERKLIIIFVLCTLFDDIVLFLDEPETSLSIIWQETIIPDLLEYTNVKNIIVATQSPYIISDDSLTKYINPIINVEDEKNGR